MSGGGGRWKHKLVGGLRGGGWWGLRGGRDEAAWSLAKQDVSRTCAMASVMARGHDSAEWVSGRGE